MINWDKIKDNWKTILLVGIVIIIIISYVIIVKEQVRRFDYTQKLIKISKKNEETTFAVEKIYLCSSANVKDSSQEQNLKNLDLYQYTDMAIYINNFEESKGLNKRNTIKNLYIDNIDLSFVKEGKGNQSLSYTNLLNIGSKEIDLNNITKDRIDFNMIYTNEENEKADYTKPTFYTDCSNPITLRYVNDLGANYSIEKNSSISFDGSILKKANISLDDIDCKIKFKINIVNNENEYSSCWINFKVPLNDIYNGTTIKTAATSGEKYNFFNA